MSTAQKLNIVKNVGQFVAGVSVSYVVATLTKTHTPTENRRQELMVVVGAVVLAGMASTKAEQYVEQKVDRIIEKIEKLQGKQTETETE